MQRLAIFEGDKPSYGWGKLTIHLALEKKARLLGVINKELVKYGLAGRIEASEVYQELLLYLAVTKDFDMNKGDNLEAYVVTCLKLIIKRAVSAYYKHVNQLVYDTVRDDGEVVSVIDLVPDAGTMPDCVNLEDEVKGAEHLRYKYGLDIPLLVYLRLLLDDNEIYRAMVELLLGVKYITELRGLKKKLEQDRAFIAFISALSRVDKKEALKALKGVVHGAESIERALQGDQVLALSGAKI